MRIKYQKNIIKCNITRLTNQIYKLLPMKEEKLNWEDALKSIIIELSGLSRILYKNQRELFQILCKLNGLLESKDDIKNDFKIFRKTIFECLNLMNVLENNICNQD